MLSKLDMRTLCCVVVAFVLFGISTPGSAQEIRWRMSVGDEYHNRFNQQSATTTTILDAISVVETKTVLDMDWHVIEVDDQQRMIIEQTVRRVQVEVKQPAAPGKSWSIDTSADAPTGSAGEIYNSLKSLIGVQYLVTMTPLGELQDVSFTEKTKKMLAQLPDDFPLQGIVDEEAFTAQMRSVAVVLPEQNLKVGESWQTVQSLKTPFGTIDLNRTYSYSGNLQQAESQIADFQVASSIDLEAIPKDNDLGKIIEFAESGSMQFDLDAGVFSSSSIQHLITSTRMIRDKKIQTRLLSRQQMTVTKK